MGTERRKRPLRHHPAVGARRAPLGVGSCGHKYTVMCLFQSARSASLPKGINKQTNKKTMCLPDMERPPRRGRRVHSHSVKSCRPLAAHIPAYSKATVHVYGSLSYRSLKAKPQVCRPPTKPAPSNPVQGAKLIAVCPSAQK